MGRHVDNVIGGSVAAPILPIVAALQSGVSLKVNSDFTQMAVLNRTLWNVGWLSGPPYNGGAGGQGFSGVTGSQNASQYFGPSQQVCSIGNPMQMKVSSPGPDTPPGAQTIEGSQISSAGLFSLDVGAVGHSNGVTGALVQGNIVMEYQLQMSHTSASTSGVAVWMTNDDNYFSGGPTAEVYLQEIDESEILGTSPLGSNIFFHLHSNTVSGNAGIQNNNASATDFSLAQHTWTWLFTNAVGAFGQPAWSASAWLDGVAVTGLQGIQSTPTPTITVQSLWAKPNYQILAAWATATTGLPLTTFFNYYRLWTH